jgi:hypothetical protein
MQPENVADYQAPGDIVELSKAYENRPGVTFVLLKNPKIRAYFKDNVSISTVALQPTYNNRTTNIVKFNVSFVTSDNQPYLDSKTGQVLVLTNPDSSLTIQHDMIPNLKGLNLTIVQTTGGNPTYFRLMVLGCYKSG